jgi:hypothetical protein
MTTVLVGRSVETLCSAVKVQERICSVSAWQFLKISVGDSRNTVDV